MVKPIKVIWTKRTEKDFKEILTLYEIDNKGFALQVIEDIIQRTESIVFIEQFQKDEVLGEPFRRFFHKHWKIVYRPNKNTITVFRVFDTRKDPQKLT